MIGTQLGPYRLDRKLGVGGMGTVYLASVVEGNGFEGDVETRPARRVAIKLVHRHLVSDERFLERFRREATVGRRIRHPNVVRTLDVGTIGSGRDLDHYLVMEYVEGRTLRRMLSDLGTVPEGLLREVGVQTAAGLAAIHEAGVVHRDLKPENILVTDDYRVRIMDLGVARLVDQQATLTRRGEFTGSLPYAAPEQFGTEAAGPAADLYSLGVVLYELATGANPFLREDAAQVIAAHLNETPQPVADRAPAVSAFLSEMIAELLAKDPAGRLGPARSVRDLLVEGEGSSWWADLEGDLVRRRAGFPEIPVARTTGIRGRDEERSVLLDLWAQARGGRGRVVLVEGEAGIGKTRLVDALLRDVGDRDVHVLYGAYEASAGTGGISGSILGKFGSAGLERALEPYLTATPRLLQGFAALNRQVPPPPGAERIQGDALHAVVCHLLRALAREKPVLWIVEDLHNAEPESRRIVLSMARALAGHRVLLVLSSNSGGLPDEDLALYGRLDGFRRIRLSRLSPRAVVELLREAFRSEELTDHLGARIAFKSDGVPFYVFEMIRGLEDARLIERREDGTFTARAAIQEIQVPSAVRDLVKARCAGQSRREREILDVGAIQGIAFDADLIARVLDLRRVAVLQDLAELERRSGVVRSDGGRLRFDHHQIQAVLYEDMMPDLRAEYHAMLAEAMMEREGVADREHGSLSGEVLCFLARHHVLGSRPVAARPFVPGAIEHLNSACRIDAALDLAERALAIEGLLEGLARVGVLLLRAGLLSLLGRRDEQQLDLEEALRLSGESDDLLLQSRTRRQMGSFLWSISRAEEADEWLRQAEELARRAGNRRQEAVAIGHRGNVHENLGRYDEARADYERAIAIHRENGDRRREGAPTGNLGLLLLNRGRPDEARRLIDRHLSIAREVGDLLGEAGATGNLALVLYQQGRYEEARGMIERSGVLHAEVGDRHSEGISEGNLGDVQFLLGRYEEARTHYERGLAISKEIGDLAGQGVALVNLGPLRAALGDAAGEQRDLEEAREIFREIGARREESYAVQGLGDVAQHRGEGAEARARFEEALALRRELDLPSGIADTLVALARLAVDEGRPTEALPLLEEAIEVARSIDDPGTLALATSLAAGLPGGDVEEAEAVLERHASRIGHAARMEIHHRLGSATGQAEHGEEARRLLQELRENAPEGARQAMIDRVPLHRAIFAST